jgi:serine/threonine protein kinase/Tfp pilus assembly protein PilF
MTFSSGSRLGPYEILAPLGAGGMGEVYRAKDPRLDRSVAIKVLPAAFSENADRLHRFEQEAKAAGALNHPNIVAVYDVGTHEGMPYVVEELLEGETLRQMLAGGKLSPRRAIDYSLQIAHGMATAHEKGIVHRDLKPENLFITRDGRAKILDFGLAKLTPIETEAASSTRARTETAGTEPGVVLGTIGYMSPEQVRGRPADPRSDIFSFGAILYEMLSGERAFRGESAAETMSAILTKDPPDLSIANQDISLGLDRVVRHCLEKSPEQRFHSARDLAFDLEALYPVSAGSSPPAARAAVQPIRWIAGAAAGITLVAAVLLLRPRSGTIESLAVLPFVNASSDSNIEYLSDGMTESLINSLSQLPNLTVMSRNSVFRYKGREMDAQATGRELRVQAVLTGRVVQRGPDLSVSAELVDTRSNRHIWGDRYNRKLSDILAVQEEIVSDISGKLRRRLTGEEKRRLGKGLTENTEAYDLYLKGRYHWNKRTAEDLQKGIGYFAQAIEKDPTYALAYTGLAESYAILPFYGFPARESLSKAKAAARKALEMDDTLPQAHAALASTYEDLDWDFPASEREYRRAIELDSKYPTAHHWYGLLLAFMGRSDEAIREVDRAYKLDPLSLPISVVRSPTFYYARRYAEATNAARETLELDKSSASAHLWLGVLLEQKKQLPEAIAELEEAVRLFGHHNEALASLGHAYAVSGKREEATRLIEELKTWPQQGYDPFVNIALVEVGLGRNEEAMEWLEKAYEIRSFWFLQLGLKVDPRWDSLRSNPRFQDLLKRIGFPS